jgi:hypothetical protein
METGISEMSRKPRVPTFSGHNFGLCKKCGKIHIHPKPMLGRHHTEETKRKISEKKSRKLLSKKMTPELAYLFGVIKGDGYFGKNFLHITTSDKEFAQVLKEKLQNWSGLNVIVKKYKTGSGGFLWYVFLNSTEAVKLFKSLNLSSLRTKEEKSSFIRGFADAEGSVTIFKNWDKKRKKYKRNYKITLYNSNKKLIRDVRKLLISLGIKSFVYKILPKNCFGKNLKYQLVISHKSMKKFSELVNFEHPEKKLKLIKLTGGE